MQKDKSLKKKCDLGKWTIFISSIFLLSLFSGILEPGLAGFEKSYFRANFLDSLSLAHLILGTAAIAGVIFLAGSRNNKLKPVVRILGIVILAIIINLTLFRPSFYSWGVRVITGAEPSLNPFAAASYEVKDIKDYPASHLEYSQKGYLQAPANKRRLTTYPPGLVVFYRCVYLSFSSWEGLKNMSASLASLGFSEDVKPADLIADRYCSRVPAAALFSLINILALTVSLILIYFIVLELTGNDKAKAVMATGAMALVPAMTLYSVSESILFMPLPLLALYIYVRFREKTWTPYVVGLLYSAGLFFSLVLIPLILFQIILFILEDKKNVFKEIGLFAAGGLTVTILLWLIFDFNQVSMILAAIKNNNEFYKAVKRTRLLSIPMNLYEFTIMSGVGWIIALVFLSGYLFNDIDFQNIGKFKGRPLQEKIFFSSTLVFCLLVLMGSVRGEVGRNWICFMPFLLINVIGHRKCSRRLFLTCSIICGLTLITGSMILEVILNHW